MACTSKLFLLFVLLALSMMDFNANARSFGLSSGGSSLVTRLKLNDESSDCWGSLMQLQSCTGEIILFFFNGETNLGDGCCHAIRTITQQCWSSMIDTLGFTTEEGDILEGYCIKSEDSPPSPPSLEPQKVIVNESFVP